MARPRLEIKWDDVDKLCGLQCSEQEIADFLGVSVDTLARACNREHKLSFAEYFAQKRGNGKIALRRAQWQLAQKGNPTMLIWLGKQHLGQSDKVEQRINQTTEHRLEPKKEIKKILNNPEALKALEKVADALECATDDNDDDDNEH